MSQQTSNTIILLAILAAVIWAAWVYHSKGDK